MANDTENPDAAVKRLEVALEKIARLTSAPPPRTDPAPDSGLSIHELTERLDKLIARLHAALGVSGQ